MEKNSKGVPLNKENILEAIKEMSEILDGLQKEMPKKDPWVILPTWLVQALKKEDEVI